MSSLREVPEDESSALEKSPIAIGKLDAGIALIDELVRVPVILNFQEKQQSLQNVLDLLKAFKTLYWECPGCGQKISPDQEFVNVNEEVYCVPCNEAGF